MKRCINAKGFNFGRDILALMLWNAPYFYTRICDGMDAAERDIVEVAITVREKVLRLSKFTFNMCVLSRELVWINA
jgi:hypothetical protein